MRKEVLGFNAEADGTYRTLKAVYFKSSMANFVRGGDWGATGVIEVYEEDNTDKCD